MGKSVRDEFYDDVLITAVEGGIGYWSLGKDYRWSDDGPTSVDVREDNGEVDEPGPWVHVDRASMVRAFSVLRSDADLSLADSIRKRLVAAWREADAGGLDASDADIVVQVAVLGDVVYG